MKRMNYDVAVHSVYDDKPVVIRTFDDDEKPCDIGNFIFDLLALDLVVTIIPDEWEDEVNEDV